MEARNAFDAYVAWPCFAPSSHSGHSFPQCDSPSTITLAGASPSPSFPEEHKDMASAEVLAPTTNGTPAPISAQALKELTGGKPIKSKNQLRRLKQKQKKVVGSVEVTPTPAPEEKVCYSPSNILFAFLILLFNALSLGCFKTFGLCST